MLDRVTTDRPAPAAAAGTDAKPALAAVGVSSGIAQSFRDVLSRALEAESQAEQAIRRLARGADLSNADLLVLQIAVERASQRVELLGKAVDRAADTARELTQIRV